LGKISLFINGNRISCASGISILNAAEDHGIKIPRLCYHHDLEPFGACRLCLVEDEKTGRIMASCVTPVAADIAVQTDTPRIKEHRKNIVRLMIAEHPESCVVCSKGNRCQLRHLAAQLGIGETKLYPMPNYKPLEQANPFIIRDLSKCILCGKCIRADHELVAVGAIDYNLRGFESRPTTAYDRGLEQSSCTFCGTCVSMCPTGALSTKNNDYVGTAERVSVSICGFCGVGCSLAMGVVGEKIVEAEPSHRQNTVNGATLCVRGHFAHDFLNSPERLCQPLVRKNGKADDQMVPVPWDGLLEDVAGRLRAIREKHGPQSIAFFGSSKCTNEENYLFQKIARALLQTNNVDNGGYLYGRSILKTMDNSAGNRCRIRPLADLEKAEAVLVLGADPVQSVPVVSYYLKRAAKKGVPVVVADTRPTELADNSSLSFNLAPHAEADGTYVALINGLAALLYGKNGQDSDFIDRFTEGFKQYSDSLAALDPENINRVTGLDHAVLASAAELLQHKKISFLVGSTILQQPYGRQTIEALVNLSLMTGSLASDAAGIHVIARENNLIGAWDMGTVPDALPGRQALNDESARKRFEQAWQTELSPDQGLDLVGMIEAAEKGELKALYILGENPLRGLPQADRIQKALAKVEYLVVQDILNSETAKLADVVLPGAAFSEKGGSFTNMEGRIQSFNSVVSPPGDARPDWEILGRLASELGHPEPYESLEDLVDDIRRSVPIYADLNRAGHSAWVKAPDWQADNDGGGHEKRIPFTPVAPPKKHAQDQASDAAYPFTAVFTSQRWHMGSGTRTDCSRRIAEFGLKGEIEMSDRDGAKLDFSDGDIVRVFSRHGAIKRSIRLNHRLSPGQICVPLAFSGNDVMNLIELTPPGRPGFAGWNTCRVNLEKVEEIIHES